MKLVFNFGILFCDSYIKRTKIWLVMSNIWSIDPSYKLLKFGTYLSLRKL